MVVERLKDIIIYNCSMSVMEISKLSRNCYDDALLNVRIMIKLNVNLMETSIRKPKSIIMIFVLPQQKNVIRQPKIGFTL